MHKALVVGCALTLPVVALAGFRVSSIKESRSNDYVAASAIDGNGATAWMIDPESEQKGEWIEIDLPKSEVDKIGIMVGWEKDDEAWGDHGRIKTVRLEVFTDGDDGEKRVLETSLTFEDKKGMQILDVEDTKIGTELSGGKARLTITDLYPGQDYPQVAVGEVRVYLKEQDATAVYSGAEPASADGHGADLMIDGNARTFFLSEGDTVEPFELLAQGWGVSSLVVTPGLKPYARPKTLVVSCADQTRTYTVQDTGKPQSFDLPVIVGYTGSAWGKIKVEVKDTYPGTKPGVAIADIGIKATNYDGF